MTIFATGRHLSLPITFTADPDGDTVELHDDTLTWSWAGGVGPFSAVLTRSGTPAGTYSTPSRTVSATADTVGSWTYLMTVTDSYGRTASSSASVTVTAPPAPASPSTWYNASLSPGAVVPVADNTAWQALTFEAGKTYELARGVTFRPRMVTQSGNSGNWITIRSAPGAGERAYVQSTSTTFGGTIHVTGSYIQIADLKVSNVHQKSGGAHGAIWTEVNHHVAVVDCELFDGSHGIGGYWASHVYWCGNTIHDTSKLFRNNGSAISMYQPRLQGQSASSDPWGLGAGRVNVVAGNLCYNNYVATDALYQTPPQRTDGNGIIWDDGRQTQDGSYSTNYAGRTVIEANICYDNSGSGVRVFQSDHVDVRFNTCYYNVTAADWDDPRTPKYTTSIANTQGIGKPVEFSGFWPQSPRGQGSNNLTGDIDFGATDDCTVHGNVAIAFSMVARDVSSWTDGNNTRGNPAHSIWATTSMTWSHNHRVDGSPEPWAGRRPTETSKIAHFSDGVNHHLTNPTARDFRPVSGSPLINAVPASYSLVGRDFAGQPRTSGTVDCGALEYVA